VRPALERHTTKGAKLGGNVNLTLAGEDHETFIYKESGRDT
jgi:hypothetical protein